MTSLYHGRSGGRHRLAWMAGFALGFAAVALLLRALLRREASAVVDDETPAGDMGTDTEDLDLQRPEARP